MINPRISHDNSAVRQHIIACTEESAKNQLENIISGDFLGEFSGKKGETCTYRQGAVKLVFCGLGSSPDAGEIRDRIRTISATNSESFDSVSTQLSWSEDFDREHIAAFFQGFLVGGYAIIEKSRKHFIWNKNAQLIISTEAKEVLEEALIIANNQMIAMDWLNRGHNQKHAPELSQFLRSMAADLGIVCHVLDRELALAEDLHAYLAVNQGSMHDAAFTILHYKPSTVKKKILLVGKCVTFDTGGVSIKSSSNMHYMKSDMGGATAVIGALKSIVELALEVEVIAILPITDNVVSAEAYIPSDVLNSHAGKTIEVIDTDAEGRLTLADGLSYGITKFEPDVVIDLATLTGSAVRTFGDACAAMFSQNEELLSLLQKAGDQTGERVWPLPMWKSYRDHLKSDVADLKNYSGTPISGATDAAIFLQEFTHKHPAWAHLDIAGVAFGKTPFGKDKNATGYGVLLLLEAVRLLIDETE